MILYKMWNKKKSAYPKVRGTHINYKVYNFFFYKHIHLTIITIQLQNTGQIEVFDSTDKTTFVIFDRDAEKILNKSARDLVEKQTEV